MPISGRIAGVAGAIAAGLLGAVLVVGNVVGESLVLDLQPGDSGTITCPTKLVAGARSAKSKTFTCKAAAASPTAAPTRSSAPTATLLPTIAPTATPSATPSPAPTPKPGADVCSTPGSVVGYGADTVGGEGGRLIEVSTVAELKAAAAASGPRIVNLAPGSYDLGGAVLTLSRPNITIEGNGAELTHGQLMVKTNQVVVRDLKSRAGDESPISADDVDAITINGNAAARDHILFDHVEMLWGPDVSGTILGRVTNVTVQCSIIGEGLLHSRHSESGDLDGHSLAFNVASEDPANAAERITLYGNLFTTSQSRQPRLIGCKACDVVDSVFYNFAEGPQGNPQSLNLIGCTWKRGPAPASIGIPFTSLLWRYQPGGHGAFDTRLDARVFLGEHQVIGYVPADPSGSDAAVLRSSPLIAPSAQSIGAAAAYQMVTASAGAIHADANTLRLRSNVVQGTGTYVNGFGKATSYTGLH